MNEAELTLGGGKMGHGDIPTGVASRLHTSEGAAKEHRIDPVRSDRRFAAPMASVRFFQGFFRFPLPKPTSSKPPTCPGPRPTPAAPGARGRPRACSPGRGRSAQHQLGAARLTGEIKQKGFDSSAL